MQKIAKDEIKYRLAQLGYAQKLNDIVFSIFKGLSKWSVFGGGDTEGVKAAKKEVTGMAKGAYATAASATSPKEQARITANVMRVALETQTKKQKYAEYAGKQLEETKHLITAMETPEKDRSKFQDSLLKNNKKSLSQLTKQKGDLEKSKKLNEDLAKKAEETYKQGTQMLTALNEIDSGTRDIADIFLHTQDPAKIGEMIAGDLDRLSLGELKDKYGEATDIEKNMIAAMGKEKAAQALTAKASTVGKGSQEQVDLYNMIKNIKASKATGPMPAAGQAPTGVPRKATLSEPQIVTSPGIVKLDPGEMMLPKGVDIKTIPAPAGPTPAGPGGATGKNISITVNATERDLAQRIANEIRSVLYNEQLTGMV
jgi:hypothetical protein